MELINPTFTSCPGARDVERRLWWSLRNEEKSTLLIPENIPVFMIVNNFCPSTLTYFALQRWLERGCGKKGPNTSASSKRYGLCSRRKVSERGTADSQVTTFVRFPILASWSELMKWSSILLTVTPRLMVTLTITTISNTQCLLIRNISPFLHLQGCTQSHVSRDNTIVFFVELLRERQAHI